MFRWKLYTAGLFEKGYNYELSSYAWISCEAEPIETVLPLYIMYLNVTRFLGNWLTAGLLLPPFLSFVFSSIPNKRYVFSHALVQYRSYNHSLSLFMMWEGPKTSGKISSIGLTKVAIQILTLNICALPKEGNLNSDCVLDCLIF